MALFYDHLGCSVLPLKSRSKEPGVRSWKEYQNRRPEREELRKWFSGGRRNIGIVCGDVSDRLVVRDFDSDASYRDWQSEYPDASKALPTVATCRGFHVYARSPESIPSKHLRDGEIRANGHYVAAPPSIHPDGPTYSWTIPPTDEIPVLDLAAAGLLTDWTSCNIEAEKRRNVSNFYVSMLHVDGVPEAIRKCIPSQVGHRHKCLFRLARELKAILELADLKGKDLHPVLVEWHQQALPTIGTKDFATSWLEFCTAWDRVRYPAGTSPVDEAWQAALGAEFPPEVADWGNAEIGRLAALCWQLQIRQGDQPFYLDSRTAGRLLGVEHTVAWRWLRGLVSAGVLELVRSGGRGRANKYRYLKE